MPVMSVRQVMSGKAGNVSKAAVMSVRQVM